MKELIKSIVSFSIAVPLYGVKQLTSLMGTSAPSSEHAPGAFDSVRRTAEEKMGERMRAIYKGGDILQRSVVDLIFRTVAGDSGQPTAATPQRKTAGPSQAGPSGRLDTSVFVALGEGIAAGMGDFRLSEEFQEFSFPALMAQQMGTPFSQPILEPPGLGDLVGFPSLPVRVPAVMQSTVLRDLPPVSAMHNLSIPDLRLSDLRTLRPVEPLVHRQNIKQTLANLILGMPDMMHKPDRPLLTPMEYALAWRPTLIILELGYAEIIEAAIRQDASLLPDTEAFVSEYTHIIDELRSVGAEVVVMTIPDPGDTAFFSPVESAAKALRVRPEALMKAYDLYPDDRITVNTLMDMGCHLIAGEIRPLAEGSVAPGDWMQTVSRRVREINEELTAVANERGALIYDLHHLYHRLREIGISLGTRRLTADYLGGFYELNGYFPGSTGQAIIANEVLNLLNRTYGAGFPMVDTGLIMAIDPVADYRPAQGPLITEIKASLHEATPGSLFSTEEEDKAGSEKQTPSASAESVGIDLEDFEPKLPLTLPPSLEQVLPLNDGTSYFGDTLRAVHCRNPEEGKWGSGGELLFGGLPLLDTHIRGNIRIRFSEPENQISRFEMSIEDQLTGIDSLMVAPQFFKLPSCHQTVKNDPQLVSSGKLNLETGEVTDLEVHVRFMNTALLSLVRVNPGIPDAPMSFPGRYGSAHARFYQRPDGNLDFTFYGSTFLPLGMVLTDGVRLPLPMCGPTLEFASIPAQGTQLHPHLHLDTRPSPPTNGIIPPDIPTATSCEFTVSAYQTCFGDKFTLNVPELGEATGRSHLMGRVVAHFGKRFGDSVSVALVFPAPGGLLYAPNPPPTQLTEEFPGRLYGGLQGHNEILRFPKETYRIVSPYRLDDPFEVSLGVVNVKTGRFVNELLCRGMIGHPIFMALLKVEPRTPRASFQFRGPAMFERDGRGQLIFRFKGQTRLEYPEGYLFPKPDLTTGYVVGPGSVLDPFFWVQAMYHAEDGEFVKKGSRENVTASTGEVFSFKYDISNRPGQPAMFEFTNHTQEARFVMNRLNWLSFTSTRESGLKPGNYDIITFTGFGTWSKDDQPIPRLVSAQISTSKDTPYISVLIDGGFLANVNIKPDKLEDVQP